MANRCAKCGSDRIIPDALLFDQGEYSDGKLKAGVHANPEAWIFKDTALSNLRARICGDCGYTELFADNVEKVFQAYERAEEKKQAGSSE